MLKRRASVFFGIHKLLRMMFTRYSTIYDSILVVRLGLWFGLWFGVRFSVVLESG